MRTIGSIDRRSGPQTIYLGNVGTMNLNTLKTLIPICLLASVLLPSPAYAEPLASSADLVDPTDLMTPASWHRLPSDRTER